MTFFIYLSLLCSVQGEPLELNPCLKKCFVQKEEGAQ